MGKALTGGFCLYMGIVEIGMGKKIGPSGVRALPLAAGISEGGHYFRYCQAQPSPSWMA